MKKCLLFIFTTLVVYGVNAQAVLHTDDFETPGTFNLGGTAHNNWVVNDVYTGGTITLTLFGIPVPILIEDVPAQPTGISSPNNNYLHPLSDAGVNSNVLNSNYDLAGDGINVPIQTMDATMATSISTQGYEDITLNLWRTGGLDGVEIVYSTDGGTTWNASGHTFTGTPASWQEENFAIPAGDDQTQFAIGFRLDETSADDPEPEHYHSIDDISITGTPMVNYGDISVTDITPASLTFCEGDNIDVDYEVVEDVGTINGGNEFTLEISDANGSFLSPTVIGTLSSTDLTGTISGTIPVGLSGTEFRVRVNASDDIMIGDENTADITISNPTFSVIGNDPTTCGGSNGSIIIQGLEPNTSHDYSYDGNALQTANSDASGEIEITGLEEGAYTDFEVVLNGCSTTENTTINLQDPTPPTVGAGNDETICEGDEITLEADNPDGATISWDNGVDDGVSFEPSSTLTYTVDAELNDCIATDDVTITVSNSPSVGAGQGQAVCPGDEITLEADNPDGATIDWDNGVDDGVAFNIFNTTVFEVTATIGSCSSTDVIQITVLDAPDQPVITENANGDLEVDIDAGETVQWFLNGTLVPGENGATLTPTEEGTYTAVIVGSNCNSLESDGFIYEEDDSDLSVMENEKPFFSIYPNPASEVLNIQISEEANVVNSSLIVKDINGRTILINEFKEQLDVSSLDKGVYFINISGNNQVVKFIKK